MLLQLAGAKIKTSTDFHREIKKTLSLPNYYGENLDALWDCLTTDLKTPLTLIWKDYPISKMYLGAFADRTEAIFEEAEKTLKVFGFAMRKGTEVTN